MLYFSAFIIGVICTLLIVVVLAQKSKGSGLAVGNNATQMFGARRATDWVEKSTWILFALLIVLSLGLNAYIGTGRSNSEPVPTETPAEVPADGGGTEGGTQQGQ